MSVPGGVIITLEGPDPSAGTAPVHVSPLVARIPRHATIVGWAAGRNVTFNVNAHRGWRLASDPEGLLNVLDRVDDASALCCGRFAQQRSLLAGRPHQIKRAATWRADVST